MRTGEKIRAFHDAMLTAYGPQHWWPADTPFEVVIGAILTQNTNWKNVERAIANLKREGLLSPESLARVPTEQLAEVIRPAGYYRIKAKRLKNFITMLVRDFGGDLAALFALRTSSLREAGVAAPAIGPVPPDSIVLYAAAKPVFVIDTYTARILYRHGVIDLGATYEDMQALMQDNLAEDVAMFQEYHALLVEVGKRQCKKAAPNCAGCPLAPLLENGQPMTY
jgi:endonuclease-3 related protein